MNLQLNQIIINKHDYKNIKKIDTLTDKTVILRNLNEDLSETSTTISQTINQVNQSFLRFTDIPLKKSVSLTKSLLTINMVIEPILQKSSKKDIRTITHIGSDYYLYTNSNNQELKDSYQSISQFKQSLTHNELTIPSLHINEYNQAINKLDPILSEVIEKFNVLQKLQNDKIKNRLILSLEETIFSKKTAFCLLENIPIKLTHDQLNHLSHNGIKTKISGTELISSPFSMKNSNEEDYENLYTVFYFSKNDLNEAINNVLHKMGI